MNSYKIKLILIGITVLINIDTIHADERDECIESLNKIGYESIFVRLNYTAFLNRIFFISDDFKDFENRMLKKKKKCLSEKPVPDDARACSELNDAQKCLFKESENNWAYRYECAMLTPIYQTELENPQSWCYNIFAAAKNKDPTSSAAMKKDPTSSAAMKKDPTSSAAMKKNPTSLAAKNKDPTSSAAIKKNPTSLAAIKKDPTSLGSLKECLKEFVSMKLNLKNGLHYYFYFYDNIHDYHVHYQNYLLQQPKTEDVTNSLKIHENNNSSNTMEVDEKTQNVNIGQEEDNYELNVKKWCKLNSTTTITTFIINNKINFESLPIDYKDEIIDTFFKVCVTVLNVKRFTINEKAKIVKGEPLNEKAEIVKGKSSFILYYETYILNKFNEGAEKLPPGNIKWCEQNIKIDSKAMTDEQQLVVDDKVTDSKAVTTEQQLVKP